MASDPHGDLSGLGWGDWFERRMPAEAAGAVARVAAVDRDLLLLVDHNGTFRAKLAGALLLRGRHPDEVPCVGDWVCLEERRGDDIGVVHSLLERRTSLRRRAPGSAGGLQMIAANVDHVIVVQACDYDFNVRRLERYLVMVADGGAEPMILLTKTDLVDPDVLAAQVAEIRAAGITAQVATLSNVTLDGLDTLRRLLLPGRTYCFVGSSGVGKSTLINRLIGHEMLQTRAVSGTGEGRHTTVRRELIRLDGGALVIDNPGMREFGIAAADGGVGTGYSDITALATGCRYRNCSHAGEPGCAVVEAVDSGQLSRERLESYLRLREESAFYQLSHAEKRKKDRDVGRHINSAKKDLGDDWE